MNRPAMGWRGGGKSVKRFQWSDGLSSALYKNIIFFISPVFQSLRPALLNVREMCYRISDMGLCKVQKGHTYTLDEFRDVQFAQLEEVWRDHVKTLICLALKWINLDSLWIVLWNCSQRFGFSSRSLGHETKTSRWEAETSWTVSKHDPMWV